MYFAICGFTKNEFNLWVTFSPQGSGVGTSLGLWGQNFVSSSDIGSVRSARPGLPTPSPILPPRLISQEFRGDRIFLNSDSEPTQIWGL